MKLFHPYVPTIDGNLVVWATTYKEKLGLLGPDLGLPPAEIQDLQKAAQAIIDGINKTDLKKVELKEATSAKDLTKQAKLQQIRSAAVRIKTLPAYNHNLGRELGIVSPVQAVDHGSLKPSLTAVSFPGYVQLSFKKRRMFGISLYGRVRGALEWQKLDVVKNSPFLDNTPLAEAGRPETREYMAVCYDGIQETGHPSNIVSVVHGG
ncbi:MAG: hypothetical protein NVSMB63_20190 [Sediminibacterium sp.]